MDTHNHMHDLANNTWWEAKSIMGIRKLHLSSKEKKLILGTANTGGALTPPQCYAYAHNLSNLLNQTLTWAPMQIPHFKLYSLRKYFFDSVSHLTLHSLRGLCNSLQC